MYRSLIEARTRIPDYVFSLIQPVVSLSLISLFRYKLFSSCLGRQSRFGG